MPTTKKIKKASIWSMLSFLTIGKQKKSKAGTPEAPLPEDGRGLEQQWFDALRGQDGEKVKELLEKGVDANIKDEHGWAAIHLVSWNGFTSVCSMLLTTPGLDVNLPGPGDSTALSLASQRGHAEIVTQLLSAHCDVARTATLGDNADVTALHLAAQNGHIAIARLLVGAGALVNAAMVARGGIKGVTPLHLAVEADHMDVMDLLIEAGADVQSSTQGTDETIC